jgi:hypothetical protein
MKSIGTQLFFVGGASGPAKPRAGFRRVAARDAGLREVWFRDAIFDNPELVIGPCRASGQVSADETWLPWKKEHNFGSGPVDVLLLSSEGRVGIVETKLSYNPQRRREVVAQVLDYALALQVDDYDDVDWPPLPDSDMAPDEADLRECIEAGRFLLIVAGDALDPRALRLSQAVLGRAMTSEWDLAMIDLNLFAATSDCREILVVPELLGTVQAQVRNVVRVQVDGGRARVEVEHVGPEEGSALRSPNIRTDKAFLEMFEDGPAREVARQVVRKFQEVSQNSEGRFQWGLRSATANLYWYAPSGDCRRIFAFSRKGVFRSWAGYLEKGGFEDEADRFRAAIQPLVSIPPDEQSARTFPDARTIDAHLAAIDAAVDALS